MASVPDGLRVLLVDDHEIVRVGLREVLQNAGIHVVGDAATAAEALRAVERCAPGIVLMDVRLPDSTGAALAREIRASYPEIKIVFLTAFEDEEALMATMLGVADGHLLKEIGSASLVRALGMVADGLSVVKPGAHRLALERMRSAVVGESPTSEPLSMQERRVLALVAEGKTNKEIGAVMALSPKTVKNYLTGIFRKLQVRRRAEAVARLLGGRTPREQ
jgi:DNA-binding NarL/FixJ family response regulator